MATRPSTLPTAKPFADGKHVTTRVCHLSGDIIVYGSEISAARTGCHKSEQTLNGVVGFERLKIWMWRSAVPTTMSGYTTSSV